MIPSNQRPVLTTRAGALLTAAAVIATGALSGCGAAPTAACTDAAVYLLDNTTATTITAGTQREWNDPNGVVLSAQPVPTNIGDSSWATFAPVGGTSSFATFLADPGSERTPKAWRLWSQATPIGTGVLLPAVWPGNFSEGAPAPVKAAGGTYSLGVAYLDGPTLESAKVVKTYLATITVTPGTGEWTFRDAPTCPTR